MAGTVLTGADAEKAKFYIDAALEQARLATCGKTQRGVVFVYDDIIIGRGFNGPVRGFPCGPSTCLEGCGRYAVHAEKRAMATAQTYRRKGAMGSIGYHIESRDGIPTPADGPYCWECAKDMATFGVEAFVLMERRGENPETGIVFVRYAIDEFVDISFMNDRKLNGTADLRSLVLQSVERKK